MVAKYVMLYQTSLIVVFFWPLVLCHNIPHVAQDDETRPLADAELEASLLDISLVDPPPDNSPIQLDILLESPGPVGILVAQDDEARPVTGAELAASLLDISLLEPSPNTSPLYTQTSYYQGDIILESPRRMLAEAIAGPDTKWPDAMVPYKLSSAFSEVERNKIVRGIAEFHKRTCIRFITRTTQIDYVYIKREDGCSSNIGRITKSQTLSLGEGCISFGHIIHELMHAIGFWHEQSRTDRDEYVNINWDNIIKEPKNIVVNFKKKLKSQVQELGLPYDYGSVMHYSLTAFAIDTNKPTIQPIYGELVNLGQRIGFSELDVRGINLLYGCDCVQCVDTHSLCSYWASKDECTKKPSYMHDYCKVSCKKCEVCSIRCGNGHFTGTNKCSCSDGYTGNTCDTPVCRGGCVNGQCTSPNMCTCSDGYTGYTCDTPVCHGGCGNGQCTSPNKCTCSDGYTGNTCDTRTGCPESEGFIKPLEDWGYSQCFRLYQEPLRSWEEAKAWCASEGMVLAKPDDNVVWKLKEDLMDAPTGSVPSTPWLGARGSGGWRSSSLKWDRDGSVLPTYRGGHFPPGTPGDYTTDSWCLMMYPWAKQPYLTHICGSKLATLCEVIDTSVSVAGDHQRK